MVRKSVKYFNERLSKGGDCTARSQMFIFDGAAKTVISMFLEEQCNKIIKEVGKLQINGVRGLCSKSDVVEIINKLKKEKFNH